jgi:hypothetical protein
MFKCLDFFFNPKNSKHMIKTRVPVKTILIGELKDASMIKLVYL